MSKSNSRWFWKYIDERNLTRKILILIMLRCKDFEFERFYLCVDCQKKVAICMIKHAFSFAKSRLLILQIAFHTILNEIEILVNISFHLNILRFVFINRRFRRFWCKLSINKLSWEFLRLLFSTSFFEDFDFTIELHFYEELQYIDVHSCLRTSEYRLNFVVFMKFVEIHIERMFQKVKINDIILLFRRFTNNHSIYVFV